MSGHIQVTPIWEKRESGRTWIGCAHGDPASDCAPVRICKECFDAVRQNSVDGALAKAAVPDLLEALKGLMQEHSNEIERSVAVNAALAAIHRATKGEVSR